MADGDNTFQNQQEGADKAAREGYPTKNGRISDEAAAISPATYNNNEAGNSPLPGQTGTSQGDIEPEAGNEEQNAETK